MHARQWLHWVEGQVLSRDSSHLTPRQALHRGGWRHPQPILLEAMGCSEVPPPGLPDWTGQNSWLVPGQDSG